MTFNADKLQLFNITGLLVIERERVIGHSMAVLENGHAVETVVDIKAEFDIPAGDTRRVMFVAIIQDGEKAKTWSLQLGNSDPAITKNPAFKSAIKELTKKIEDKLALTSLN